MTPVRRLLARPGLPRTAWLGVVLAVATVVMLAAPATFVPPRSLASPHPVGTATPLRSQGWTGRTTAAAAVDTGALLAIGASASPSTVCGYGVPTCPENTTITRVTLTASTPAPSVQRPEAAQILFVGAITMFTAGCEFGFPACPRNMSDGLWYMDWNATEVAEAIVAANPGMNLTFGWADTQGSAWCGNVTPDPFDDCDGWVYRVPAGNFVNATAFGRDMTTAAASWLNDLDAEDNQLHSSWIASLYQALEGNQVNWTPGERHVLVTIGASAPMAAGYSEDMCALNRTDWTPWTDRCITPTCEASFTWLNTTSPLCEGWVQPQDGNPLDSIAELARTAGPCVSAFGAVCSIDTIDLYATPTDPSSPDWVNASNPSSNHTDIQTNVDRVIDASCALANATGGTWDGPTIDHCPGGPNGTLGCVPFSTTEVPPEPTLLTALSHVGLGSNSSDFPPLVYGSSAPLFTFELAPNVTLPSNLHASATCLTPEGPLLTCPAAPEILRSGNSTTLAWNFSTDPTTNDMSAGSSWSASFDLEVRSPPTAAVPLDLVAPLAGSSGGPGAAGSAANFAVTPGGSLLNVSFPRLSVAVAAPSPLRAVWRTASIGGEAPFLTALSAEGQFGLPPYVQYNWSFGDGATTASEGPTVWHAYGSPGVYHPTVTVVDSLGATATNTTTLTVYPRVDALAVVNGESIGEATWITGAAPFTVRLDGVVTDGVAPFDFNWSLGDGGLQHGASSSYVYSLPGQYSARLTVTDALGYESTVVWEVLVNATPTAPPPSPLALGASLTNLTPIYGEACGGAVADFSSTVTGGTPPYSVSWGFGDGTTGTGADPSHHYAGPGTYAVWVTAEDSALTVVQATLNVLVPAVPCPSHPNSAYAVGFGYSLPFVAGLGALAVGVAVLGVLVARRRRPPARRQRRRP